MRKAIALSLSILCVGLLSSTGCSSDPRAPDEEAAPSEGVYRTTLHFPGFDEDVTIVKTPGEIRAVRQDGRRVGYLEFLAEERAAYRIRFGALTPELQRALDAGQRRIFKVGVTFDVPVDWSAIGRGMEDDATHAETRTALGDAIARTAAVWRPRLETMGMHVSRTGETMPVILGAIDPKGLLELRALDGVRVWLDGDSVVTSDVALDTVKSSHIDVAYNQPTASGSYASSERIGILEPMGSTKRIFETHEAFTQATIAYQTPPSSIPCKTTDDCGCKRYACGGCWDQNVACAAGFCVSDHTSKTASVLSAYTAGQPWSSAKARLYVANAGAGSFASNSAAFEYFAKENVKLVNMSFSYSAPEGAVEDYYGRLGMLVMKSAGNSTASNPAGACAFQTNAVCVGAVRHDLSMWADTVTANPSSTDREEPDVVALGGDDASCADTVHALKANSPTTNDWSGFFNATSAATPVITSMMALTREYCVSQGRGFSPRWARAILKASLGADATGWRYETPGKSPTGKDGAGYPYAEDVKSWCSPGTNKESGDAPVDLTGGGPGPTGSPPPREPPIGPFKSLPLDLKPLSGATPGPSDGRKYKALKTFSFNKNARLRAVISWDACATGPVSQPVPVVPDFDLFLHTPNGGGKYVFSSQSVSDNSEGFDIDIPVTGTYTVYLAWPAGATACGGGTTEPLAWALRWIN